MSRVVEAKVYSVQLSIANEKADLYRTRRLLRRWRENLRREKAAVKIQALWRGWQGRLMAAWARDRAIRFEILSDTLHTA